MTTRRYFVCLLLAMLLGLGLAACQKPAPDDLVGAANTNCYRAQGGDQWVCASGGEMQFESGSQLDVQAGATVALAADPNFSGGVSSSNWLKVAAPTAIATATPAVVIDSLAAGSALLEIRDSATPVARFTNGGGFMFTGLLTGTAGSAVTVTNGAAFTITAAFQPITASGTVTPTLTIPAAGIYACLFNSGSNTINLADTGNQVLTTAWAAGQYDWLCGYSDGTRFMEISRANN